MTVLVTGVGQPRPAAVEHDDYIPLIVNWILVGNVRSVYCRIQDLKVGTSS
jgi:hypothetical protein